MRRAVVALLFLTQHATLLTGQQRYGGSGISVVSEPPPLRDPLRATR